MKIENGRRKKQSYVFYIKMFINDKIKPSMSMPQLVVHYSRLWCSNSIRLLNSRQLNFCTSEFLPELPQQSFYPTSSRICTQILRSYRISMKSQHTNLFLHQDKLLMLESHLLPLCSTWLRHNELERKIGQNLFI